jgi:hypothetical protein
MSEDFAAMAAPSEEHERLKPFVGAFKAEVKMWMGPGDPAISTGVMVNELDLGGRFLRETYTGDPSEGPFPEFEGRGYWGYNKVSGQYEGFWIDTASTVMQSETGDVDDSGKVWTMMGEMDNPQTGQKIKKKSVITLVDDDHHRMEMFFEGPDGSEMKGMEIRYVRES